MRTATVAAAAALTATCLLDAQTPSADWPQFLGPNRDGTASAFTMPASPRLVEAWRRPLPAGSSSIIVVGGRAFTMGSDGETDLLFALDAATGADVWKAAIGKTHADAASGGPASTPAAAGDLIVAVGSACVVKAVRAKDGGDAWQVDLGADYKSRFVTRGGCGMSPVVENGLVILQTGATEANRLVALDAATGKLVWSSGTVPRSVNTTAALWTTPAGAQVLYHYAKPPGLSGLSAVNLKDGAVAWEIDAEAGMSNQPVLPLPGNRVMLQTWGNTSLIEAPAVGSDSKPRRLWTTTELTAGTTPAVYLDGHAYGFGGNSGEFLKCIDVASGTTKWTTRPYRGAAVLVGRTLVIQSESSGLLRLAAADPTGYKETARLEVFKPGATTHTPPSFAGGRVYVRNQEEIVAVSIR